MTGHGVRMHKDILFSNRDKTTIHLSTAVP